MSEDDFSRLLFVFLLRNIVKYYYRMSCEIVKEERRQILFVTDYYVQSRNRARDTRIVGRWQFAITAANLCRWCCFHECKLDRNFITALLCISYVLQIGKDYISCILSKVSRLVRNSIRNYRQIDCECVYGKLKSDKMHRIHNMKKYMKHPSTWYSVGETNVCLQVLSF